MNFLRLAFKGHNQWHLYLAGICIVIFCYFLGQLPLFLAYFSAVTKYNLGTDDLKKFEDTMDFSILNISSNLGLVLMISLFIFTMAGIYIACKIHKKSFLDLISTRRPLDKGRILFGFVVWMLLTFGIEFCCFLLAPDDYHFTANFNVSSFVVLSLIAFLLLPIQTSAEEIFFRGYLSQALFFLSRYPIVPILVSSILFSLVHSMNPEVEKFGFWTMQVYYIGAGIFLALLAYLDDGLEIPLGVHAATNIYGVLFVKYEGSVLQTNSLFTMKLPNAMLLNFIFYISAFVFIYIVSKKYKWNKGIRQIFTEITTIDKNEIATFTNEQQIEKAANID